MDVQVERTADALKCISTVLLLEDVHEKGL